jgi:hypothetical protein
MLPAPKAWPRECKRLLPSVGKIFHFLPVRMRHRLARIAQVDQRAAKGT